MSIKKTVEINAKFLSVCECTMSDPVYSTHFKFITRQQFFNPESNSEEPPRVFLRI